MGGAVSATRLPEVATKAEEARRRVLLGRVNSPRWNPPSPHDQPTCLSLFLSLGMSRWRVTRLRSRWPVPLVSRAGNPGL